MTKLFKILFFFSLFQLEFGNIYTIDTLTAEEYKNTNSFDGGSFMMDYVRKNPNDFNDISRFKADFDDSKGFIDVVTGNGKKAVKWEFKSWSPTNVNVWGQFFKGKGGSYNQFKTYLKNTDKIEQLKYVFNPSKADITAVKNAFKDLFTAKKTEIFEAVKPELREYFR